MSVESFNRKYKPGSSRADSIRTRPEFLQGHSTMRSLADSFYHEGQAGIVSTSARMHSERVRIPDNPLEVPDKYRELILRNTGAVLWSSLFRTTEETITNREYDPLFLYQLLKEGFEGTDWFEGIDMDIRRPHPLTTEEIESLMQMAKADKRFTFLFTKRGFEKLPEMLQEDVLNTGLYDGMVYNFGPILHPIVEMMTGEINP